ncbi:MAG: type II secretion system protein GspL, partial [Hyphomonas sp.]
MGRRLYVLLPEPGAPVECAIAEGAGITFVCGDTVPAQPRDEVIILVPGTEVGCHSVRLPAQPPDLLRRSAAYALEDEIAVPVEEVHVAVGQPSGPAGSRPAVVGGGPPARGRGAAMAGRRGRRADSQPPADREPEVSLILRLAQWAELQGSLTDLRQGRFAPQAATGYDLRAWRPVLAGAAATLVLFAGAAALEASALSRLQDALDARARSVYAAAHPGAPVPADLRAVLRGQDPSGRAPRPGFLELSALLYEALPEAGPVTLRGLSFDAATGQLVASLSYPDFGGDIDIKTQLEARGLKVTLGDSR